MRDFAVSVVGKLRDAGHEALWAGGCVRDALLGLTPKDYDVATSATPEQVRQLFGQRNTLAVGESFGVIVVLGKSRREEQIEVATFRTDGEYSDGRRPSEVTFCSAEEDAKRRDFTINGLFYDPLADQVIDYVDGKADLHRQLVRAVGKPSLRFKEDKLRMLRAVRFAATFEFALEPDTANAVRQFAPNLSQVSIERITAELTRMLSHTTRASAVKLLAAVNLLPEVFPWRPHGEDLSAILPTLEHLRAPTFEPSLSVLFRPLDSAVQVAEECRRLRLSNKDSKCLVWLNDSVTQARLAESSPLHVSKPLLSDERADLLLDVLNAEGHNNPTAQRAFDFLTQYRAETPAEVLNPAPLITGQHLHELEITPGPQFKSILNQIRNEQLDEQLNSVNAALARVAELSKS